MNIITQKYKKSIKSVDSPGVEPGRFEVSTHPSEPAEPTPSQMLPQAQDRNKIATPRPGRGLAMTQGGFIGQALMVLLLVAGIGLGTYLVGQRTNLLPRAQEDFVTWNNPPADQQSDQGGSNGVSSGNGSGGRAVACDGQSLATQSERSRNDFTAKYCGAANANNLCDNAKKGWVSEHEQELKNQGTPCGSTNTPGASCKLTGLEPATSSTCANWLDNKDPSLIDSIKKSGADFSNCTRAQIVSYWCNGSGKTECEARKKAASACGGTGTDGGPSNGQPGGQQPGQQPATQACTQDTTKAYFDAKVANRYARYKAILAGIPSYCVQADLGALNAPITADSVNDSGQKDGVITNGRLYLCSGANSSKDKLDLVWRAVSTDGKDNRPTTRPNPGSDLSKVSEVMGDAIKAAEKMLGIQ